MKKENKIQLKVQIPDEIIKNSLFTMDSNTFIVYSYLKFLHFRNYNNDELEIDHKKFKNKLFISDNRTLKKCLTTLHKNNIILEYIDKFPTKGSLTFTFVPEPFKSERFTQLPVNIFNRLEQIGANGMRLLFYYESYINRGEHGSNQFAFPSLETISSDLKLNRETIIHYNTILSKYKLIKITKHKLESSGEYNDLDQALFTKYANHYHVRVDKI